MSFPGCLMGIVVMNPALPDIREEWDLDRTIV